MVKNILTLFYTWYNQMYMLLEEINYDNKTEEMKNYIEGLNSVAFEFYQMEKCQLVEHDIYADKRYNSYLSDDLKI